MNKLYFIINNCKNHKTIVEDGGGASELLFFITAMKLADHFSTTIINSNNYSSKIDNVQYMYLPNNLELDINNSVIVVQRHFSILIDLHIKYPSNRYILWSHDFLENKFTHLSGNYTSEFIDNYFAMNNIITIAVSNFHKQNILLKMPNIKIYVIYNALFPELYPKNDNTVINNYIVFASNWAKGIDRVIDIGKEYYKKNTHFKLLLLKPSYCMYEPDLSAYPFIEIIGNIKNKEEYCMILQKSICVLTTSYPETFGCVFAEALHLGVPVIGDNSIMAGFHEIINKDYICNFKQIDKVIDIIERIITTKPTVMLDSKFYGNNIILEWIKMIEYIMNYGMR